MLKNLTYALARRIDRSPFWSNLVFRHLYLLKFFFPTEKDYYGLLNLFDKSQTGDFIDIGGNIGQSTISFRQLGFVKNRILIFEPNSKLLKRLELIQEQYGDVEVFNFGLSDKNEDKILYTPVWRGKPFLAALASFDQSAVKLQLEKQFKSNHEFDFHEQKCRLRCFDDLKLSIDPKFIKIDVEGYEAEVIFGMTKVIEEKQPVLLVEYNPISFDKILSKLKQTYLTYYFDWDQKQLIRVEEEQVESFFQQKDNLSYKSVRNIFFIPSKFKNFKPFPE